MSTNFKISVPVNAVAAAINIAVFVFTGSIVGIFCALVNLLLIVSLVRSEQLYGRHRQATTQVYLGASGQSYILAQGAISAAGAAALAAAAQQSGYIAAIPERTAIEDAGIRAGEIVAIRAWRVVGDRRLHSVSLIEYEWKASGIAGDRDQFDVPVREGGGVHAFKDRATLDQYLECQRTGLMMLNRTGFVRTFASHAFIIGTVQLWGEIVEHERGYRAEFGKIASLDEVVGGVADLDALRARYGLTS